MESIRVAERAGTVYLNATVAAGLRASGQDHGSQKRPAFPTVLQDEGERNLSSYLRRIDEKPSEEEHCVVGVVDEVSANSRAALPVVRHRTLEPDTIRSGRRFRHKTIGAPPRYQHTNLLGREPWFASNGHQSCDRL